MHNDSFGTEAMSSSKIRQDVAHAAARGAARGVEDMHGLDDRTSIDVAHGISEGAGILEGIAAGNMDDRGTGVRSARLREAVDELQKTRETGDDNAVHRQHDRVGRLVARVDFENVVCEVLLSEV